MNNKNEIVKVFSGDLYQATMVKDILEAMAYRPLLKIN